MRATPWSCARCIKMRLLITFFAIVGLGIMLMGYLFSLIR
jgi:hypothetical protein